MNTLLRSVGGTVEEERAKPRRLQRQPTRSFTEGRAVLRRTETALEQPTVASARHAAFVFPVLERQRFG
jgi:hypothetical protein